MPTMHLQVVAIFLLGRCVFGVTNEHFVEKYGEFPYMVALEITDPIFSCCCSGAIIAKDKVITAANCAHVRGVSGVKVHAGVLQVGGTKTSAQVREVEEIVVHPQFYQKGLRIFRYNLAIWKIKQEFDFDENVYSIKVLGDINLSDVVTAVSYGSSPSGRKLKKIDLSTVLYDECGKQTAMTRDYRNMVCAVDAEEVQGRTCFDELGGPLVKHFPNQPEKDVLIGVAAFVNNKCGSKRIFGFANSTEFVSNNLSK